MKYLITKRFTNGILKGITIKEYTEVKFVEGQEYKECVGSGKYIIDNIIPVGNGSIFENIQLTNIK